MLAFRLAGGALLFFLMRKREGPYPHSLNARTMEAHKVHLANVSAL